MKTFYHFFLLLPFLSCSTTEVDELLVLYPESHNAPIELSELGEKLTILEVKSHKPIGGIPEILLSESYIYLFDQDYTHSLYQIDLDGNILNQLEFGYDGKINIDGITNIITKDDQIGVISRGSEIIWFGQDLEELNRELLPHTANYHLAYGAGYVSFNNSINESLAFDFISFSDKGIKSTGLPLKDKEYKFVYKAQSPFTNWNNSLLFTKAFNDTIYRYDERNGFNAFAVLDFGKKKIPEDHFLKVQNAFDMMEFFNQKRYHYLSGDIFSINRQKVMTSMNLNGKTSLGFWNTRTNSFNTYPYIKDNIKTGMNIFHINTSAAGKLLIGISGEDIQHRAAKHFKASLNEGYDTSYFILMLETK